MPPRFATRTAFAAVVLALSAAAAAFATSSHPGPSAAFAHEGSDLRPDPGVRWGRLDNGLRYAILPNREPKGRASLRITFAAGSLHENDDQRGLAHFLEHMAFNGSRNFPPGTLIEYFQRLGMGFGNDTNAFTGFDRTSYLLELPDTQEATLTRALTLFEDYLGGLLLLDSEIDRERGVILAEKVARDSIEFRQFIGEFEFLLPETRFIHRVPIGTEEVISSAPRERFVDFYDTWYRPDLATIVAVGDFDPALVERLVRERFAAAAARAPARPAPDLGRVRDEPGVTARFRPEPEAAAIQIAIQVVRPHAPEPDTAAARLRHLPRRLALSMLNRRLAILAKQEGAPFLGGLVGATEQFDFFHNAAIELTCKPGQWREALAVAEQELRRALEHGFQAAELREASASMRNSLEQAVRTAPTRRSESLANALAAAFVEHEVFTHPASELELTVPALEKVTLEDCLRALRGTWAPEFGRRLWMTGNLQLDGAEADMVAAHEASRAVAVAPPARIEDAAFAYTDFGPAGAVAREQRVEDLGVTLVEFDNGVRLNLKPTDFEAGRVRVSVRVGGGMLTEPKDKPALAFLASNTFLAGGTGRHGADDLQRMLAGRTIGTNFTVGADAFTFGGTTNRADLLLQLQVICAHLVDPGFRPEAMRQYAKGVEVFYTRLGNMVEGPLQLEAPRLLADGDPRFGVPPREAAAARTQDEARAWLAPEFRSGAVEVAIVGDFDPAEALAAAARTFGALPRRQPKPGYEAERVARFAPVAVVREFSTVTDIQKGIVQLFWEATDNRNVDIARRLTLLAAVLDDRLRVRIREEMGDTYAPSAGAMLNDTFTGYGHLLAASTVAPDKARTVADAIRSIAADLHAGGVTDEELVRAKQPALTAIRQSLRTNPYWLGGVLSSAQERPERLDWARTRLSGMEAITAAELSALARQYLRPDKVHEFISLPAPKKAD